MLQLNTALRAGDWQPARTVSFIVNHPKTREIHAPDFADRVVHHLLVERLEALYEPIFIHDSYANRAGKGSHAAVDRLQAFMRQQNGRGWFLQLDIHNYFNSIHRPTLYGLLKRRIGKSACSAGVLACTPATGRLDDVTRGGAVASPERQSEERSRRGRLRSGEPCSAGIPACTPATGRLDDATEGGAGASRERQSEERSRRGRLRYGEPCSAGIPACTPAPGRLDDATEGGAGASPERQSEERSRRGRLRSGEPCSAGIPACTPASGRLDDVTRGSSGASPERQSEERSRRGRLRYTDALALQSLCHKLLVNPVREHVSDPAAAARIPPHKRLANAAPGCGLPVGNLTSQFFANVYLNELDQFIKHQLKCRRYLRYVDDFVLLADTREQLLAWQVQIETFLASRLRLKLKDDARLGPLTQGVDFLGYLVFPTHRLVRPRVLRHCRAKIEAWGRRHVHTTRQGLRIRADAPDLEALQALLGSYWGHFKHANSARLRWALFARFAWLGALFRLDADARGVPPFGKGGQGGFSGVSHHATVGEIPPNPPLIKGGVTAPVRIVLAPRWVLQGATFQQQSDVFAQESPEAWCLLQRGNRWMAFPITGRRRELTEVQAIAMQTDLRRRGVAYVRAAQTGWLKHGTRRREVVEWFFPAP